MIQILRDVLTIPLGIALCSISGEAQTDKSLPKAPVTGRQVPCPATGPFLDIKASGDPAEQQCCGNRYRFNFRKQTAAPRTPGRTTLQIPSIYDCDRQKISFRLERQVNFEPLMH